MRDPNIWTWFNAEGSAKSGSMEGEVGELQMFDERLRGYETSSPNSTGKNWSSTDEARFRPSTGAWHVIFKDPVSGEAVLKHVQHLQKKAEDIWFEQVSAEHGRKVESADLGGRLPSTGEMYKGLGLYLCRNLMETYRPGSNYDITVSPTGIFENISEVARDPDHKDTDFPLKIGSHCKRYREFNDAMEALAQLMEAHGNTRHATEFREAMQDLNLDE
jgi:hypothetical protein